MDSRLEYKSGGTRSGKTVSIIAYMMENAMKTISSTRGKNHDMKYHILLKVQNEFTSDVEAYTMLLRQVIIDERRKLWKLSKRFVGRLVVMANVCEDDFIYDRFTVRITGNVYKMNRIIKNSLFKKSFK